MNSIFYFFIKQRIYQKKLPNSDVVVKQQRTYALGRRYTLVSIHYNIFEKRKVYTIPFKNPEDIWHIPDIQVKSVEKSWVQSGCKLLKIIFENSRQVVDYRFFFRGGGTTKLAQDSTWWFFKETQVKIFKWKCIYNKNLFFVLVVSTVINKIIFLSTLWRIFLCNENCKDLWFKK